MLFGKVISDEIKTILKITSPVFFGYIALGTGAGLLMAERGYPAYLTLLMSCFFYAGSGQYLAAGLFAGGASIASIVFAEAVVNLRHIVYGISLLDKFRGAGKFKPYLIFALTDETYALLTSVEIPERINKTKFCVAVSGLNQFYWICGTVFGHLLGSALTAHGISLEGIDFSLTALFAVLLTEQILKTKIALPAVTGAVCTGAMIAFWKLGILHSANDILFCSLVISILFIVIFTALRKNHSQQQNATEVHND